MWILNWQFLVWIIVLCQTQLRFCMHDWIKLFLNNRRIVWWKSWFGRIARWFDWSHLLFLLMPSKFDVERWWQVKCHFVKPRQSNNKWPLKAQRYLSSRFMKKSSLEGQQPSQKGANLWAILWAKPILETLISGLASSNARTHMKDHVHVGNFDLKFAWFGSS